MHIKTVLGVLSYILGSHLMQILVFTNVRGKFPPGSANDESMTRLLRTHGIHLNLDSTSLKSAKVM